MSYNDPATKHELDRLRTHIDMRFRELESTIRWSRTSSGEEFLPLLMFAPTLIILLVVLAAKAGS